MIKMKRYALLLTGLIFLSLAGCENKEPLQTITDNPSSVSASSDTAPAAEPSEDIPASPPVSAESKPAENVPETQQHAEETEAPSKPSGTEYAAEEKEPAQTEETTNFVSPAPPPKEAEPQKPNPVPTQPPVEEPPQSKPPQETVPPEEPTVPDFNIQTWIDYAKDYAVSVGLRLESSAVDCWDNPITAGPHSLYLERDIQSRLNRYARDEDITDVWIWAEEHSDGNYDLYIGYA
ncbi:MAG: hypothetical protein KHW87_00785 [Clostridiales bacterium]|nr:hypothetical protein [Clostridiales bacterium]